MLIWLGEHGLDEDRGGILEGLVLQYGPPINWGTLAEAIRNLNRLPDLDNTFEYYVTAFATLSLLANDFQITELPFFPESHFTKQISEEEMRKAELLGSLPGRTGGPLDLDQYNTWRGTAVALMLIMTRAYWTRVWIIQEAVLGPDALVHFGEHIVPLSIFIEAEQNLTKHYYVCCSKWGANAMGAKWTKLTGVLEELSIVKGFGHLRVKVQSNENLSLYDVMYNLPEEREATNPRDHIYGLLGLVNDPESEVVVPDYHFTTSEVYTQATFKMISDRRDLLPLVHADRQRHESHGLPSWVPDWSAFAPFNPSPYDWCLFRACENQPVTAELVQGSTLILKGIIVDTVSQTGARMVWEHQRVYNALLRITDWGLILAKNEAVHLAYSNNGDITNLNKAFWRTIFGDSLIASDGQNYRLSLADVDTISSWWN